MLTLPNAVAHTADIKQVSHIPNLVCVRDPRCKYTGHGIQIMTMGFLRRTQLWGRDIPPNLSPNMVDSVQFIGGKILSAINIPLSFMKIRPPFLFVFMDL